jgi:translation initiation factor 1 (eIF-1/SUI1)
LTGPPPTTAKRGLSESDDRRAATTKQTKRSRVVRRRALNAGEVEHIARAFEQRLSSGGKLPQNIYIQGKQVYVVPYYLDLESKAMYPSTFGLIEKT